MSKYLWRCIYSDTDLEMLIVCGDLLSDIFKKIFIYLKIIYYIYIDIQLKNIFYIIYI